jgi:hypothetical protein
LASLAQQQPKLDRLFYCFDTVKFEFFLCHPGLEPGSRMQSRSLQKAVVNAGPRVFARDDKEGTTPQAIHISSGWIHKIQRPAAQRPDL